MSLFFDADWFDARLAERGLDRNAMANAAGIERSELHLLFANERGPTHGELTAFAALLGADLIEISLRCGVASRVSDITADTGARIEDIEARLDAIDTWIADLEAKRRA